MPPDPAIWPPSNQQFAHNGITFSNANGIITSEPHRVMDVHAFEALPRPDVYTVDLYAGIYYAIRHGMTSVVLVTDFEDGYIPAATRAVLAAMRAAHISLSIVSVERRAESRSRLVEASVNPAAKPS